MLGLVCIDVDGTLVGSGGVVPEVVWQTAERVRAAGVRLALCSGRPAVSLTREYAVKLDPQGWHIFQNGASLVNVGSGESVSSAFPQRSLTELVERARRTGRVLEVYSDTDYAVERGDALSRRHAELLGVPFVTRDLLSLPGKVVRLQWVVLREQAKAVEAEAYPGLTLHPSVSPVMTEASFISITAEGVSKGAAIHTVAAQYGLSMDRVMMVGDAENDVSALRVVGHPVAMGNADEASRAVSRHVVGRVDDGGLAEALELALTL